MEYRSNYLNPTQPDSTSREVADVGRRSGAAALVFSALAAVTLISGCAQSQAGAAPRTAPTGSLVPRSTATKAEADPLRPYPSQPGNLPTVVVGRSVPALSFAALDVARAMNFFGYVGVKVQYQTLAAGSQMLEAVTSQTINMGDSASTEVATGFVKGLGLEAVENTSMMTQQLCVAKSWADAHHVTPQSSMTDKMKAMKGAKIAISGPGSVSDTLTRWLLQKYGGLNPDTDASLIQIGGATAYVSALQGGKIQAFLNSAPGCASTDNGEILVQATDVPEWKNYVHEVLYTKSSWASANKNLATRTATAVAMGNNFILKHPTQALAILEKQYSSVSPAIIKQSFEQTTVPNTRSNGQFDQSMWQSTSDVLKQGGFTPKPLDASPNVVWTNNYINVGAAQVF
jgi:NitT/TauT family transport system substrate-binding protein